jgi:hypothetical protein
MSGCSCVRVDVDATEPLENLLRFVVPYVPEIPYDLALDMLRQSYTEFARLTSLLVSHFDIPLQRDVRTYMLEPPEGYEVYGLLNMAEGYGTYLRYPNPNTWCFSWGQRFRMLGNTILEFDQAPSRDDIKRTIALHLLPTICADNIPTEISTPFGEAIAAGAQRRALEIPNKPWTNMQLAQLKRRDFARGALSGRNLHIANRGATAVALKPVRIL